MSVILEYTRAYHPRTYSLHLLSSPKLQQVTVLKEIQKIVQVGTDAQSQLKDYQVVS